MLPASRSGPPSLETLAPVLVAGNSQRLPAKPEACQRWGGSKPLGPSERSLSIRSRWVLRAFGAGLLSTIGDRNGTSFTPGDAPLPGASRCSPLLIPAGAPISAPGCTPGIVKLWEPPRQSRGDSRLSKSFHPKLEGSPPSEQPNFTLALTKLPFGGRISALVSCSIPASCTTHIGGPPYLLHTLSMPPRSAVAGCAENSHYWEPSSANK